MVGRCTIALCTIKGWWENPALPSPSKLESSLKHSKNWWSRTAWCDHCILWENLRWPKWNTILAQGHQLDWSWITHHGSGGGLHYRKLTYSWGRSHQVNPAFTIYNLALTLYRTIEQGDTAVIVIIGLSSKQFLVKKCLIQHSHPRVPIALIIKVQLVWE